MFPSRVTQSRSLMRAVCHAWYPISEVAARRGITGELWASLLGSRRTCPSSYDTAGTRQMTQVGHGSGGRVGGLSIRSPPPYIPFTVKGLNHISIAVPDLELAAEHFRTVLGAHVSEKLEVPSHGVTVVMVHLGGVNIELLHPLGGESVVAKYLAKNPAGGLHHVCFTVDDVAVAGSHLTSQGIRLTGDGMPRLGAHNNPVLFINPKDNLGVLCELEQVYVGERDNKLL